MRNRVCRAIYTVQRIGEKRHGEDTSARRNPLPNLPVHFSSYCRKNFPMQTLMSSPRVIASLSCSPMQLKKNGLNFRSFSSTASEYTNQSRGGLPRFFSETLPSSKGGIVRVEGDEFWHMTKVLRLNVNDRIQLFNGKGSLVEGRIGAINCTGVDFEALENPKLVQQQMTQWHVFAAFGSLKGGRADWLIEKCTELGARSVTPLLTERSHSISENRVDRLQRLILASSKQCQRLHQMILEPPIEVSGLLPIVAQSKLSLVAVAEATPVFSSLNSLRTEHSGVMIIGPEGDFTKKELNEIMESGATAVGLGPHRLRVETATVALLSTLMLWSDSREINH